MTALAPEKERYSLPKSVFIEAPQGRTFGFIYVPLLGNQCPNYGSKRTAFHLRFQISLLFISIDTTGLFRFYCLHAPLYPLYPYNI